VFRPLPSRRCATECRFEAGDDGVTWKAYSLKRMPTRAAERAQFVAPNQARIDMALCYAGGCVFDASFFELPDRRPARTYTATRAPPG
jgi:hypothetical protein